MARRQTQLSFTGKGLKRPCDRFGGSLLKGNPKTARPVESKMPIHLVLRARKSQLRLPTTFKGVNQTVRQTADKYGIKIYSFANVGNHLHMVIKISDRQNWKRFIREVTGRIAALVKSALSTGNESFWLYRPFTRIIRSWKKAFRMALDYVYFNQLEAEGRINRSQITSLHQLRSIFSDG